MHLEYKEVEGFEFVKIGQAVMSDTPIIAKGTSGNYKLAFESFHLGFLTAEQSTYLVYEDEDLIYVGYYSGSFKDRWLRKQNDIYYFWHSDNIDDYCNKVLLEKDRNITIWLSVDPYAKTLNDVDVNISKYLEDKIIMTKKPKLNKVGISLEENKKNTLPVKEILKAIK